MRRRVDVLVIGGGPAGSTAANLLARAGRSVVVVEKAAFPRHHVGESLLPGLNFLYKRLGVAGALKREGFFKKTGGSYLWGRSRRPWSITFADLSEAPAYLVEREHTYAYHVNRARFDQILLSAARRRGAEVIQPSFVEDLDIKGRAIRSATLRDPDGRSRSVKAKYVLDASGQAAVLSRKLGWRVFDSQLRHIAVYGYWSGARLFSGARRNHIFVENIPDGWVWFIPLGEGRVSVGAVTSLDNVREARAGLEDFLRARIARTRSIRKQLARARRDSPVRLERDWSFRSRRFAGDNFLLLGDAAAFIDPLLSYGVTLAMHSGALAAECVIRALKAPREGVALLKHYEAAHRRRFDELLDFTKFFYNGNRHRKSYFWKARRIVDYKSNEYAKYAFTYLASGYTMWNSVMYRSYYERFFRPLGKHVRSMKRDPEFLEAVSRLEKVNLSFIDEALPVPGKKRSARELRESDFRYAYEI